MVAVAYSVAFEGVEAQLVEVQCAIAPGLPGFTIVGLPDKAVSEARERVRAAFSAISIALPNKRVTVNLSPADLPKEGAHFDLPIALAILAALDVVPLDELGRCVSLGELALDGRLVPVLGALPAAMAASEGERALICPQACGKEAAWISTVPVFAPRTLREAVDHLTDQRPLTLSSPGQAIRSVTTMCLSEVRGQERAKRALEIAAAGRHHMLMSGPPGAGKSMLAGRLAGLLPELTPIEALETSMIHSLAGLLQDGGISRNPPFREPHHTASMAAMIGGGRGARPGEVSLAHNGVLFLDELPEFSRQVLETLRQPVESGEVTIARANAHIRYPCRFMLIAAANPCRCGFLSEAGRACARAPKCGEDYLGRISGPLLDRFDLRVDLPAVQLREFQSAPQGETTADILRRISKAREIQSRRFEHHPKIRVNADVTGGGLDEIATPDSEGQSLIFKASEQLGLTARGYHRTLRTARSIADLDASEHVRAPHVAEALSYRMPVQGQ